MRDLLGQHLSLTKSEAVARISEDWSADVAAFDDIFTEILTMADALAAGIVAQFPDRFGGAEAGGGSQAGATPRRSSNGDGATGDGASRRRTRFRSSLGA